MKMSGWHHRDAVAGESLPPRRRSPPIATETDESVAPHRAALRRSMLQRQAWKHSIQRGWTHILHHCSIQERYKSYFLWSSKQKLTTWKLCGTVWWSYSPNEILNGGSCATNWTKFGQIGFKRNWSLHQMKLETDGQNGFPLSRFIFFM
jgi:hypothetical protein